MRRASLPGAAARIEAIYVADRDDDSWPVRTEPLAALTSLLSGRGAAPGSHDGAPPLGYLDDATYQISPPEEFSERAAFTAEEWNNLLNRSRRDVLTETSASPLQQRHEAYCRASADVTMKGGTTSGVVYPLAVCEIARSFKLRNVGGASAGAIAAAAAAAAELGRTRMTAGLTVATQPGGPRPGFAGLASIPEWLAQLEPTAPTRDEHRLASLFEPTDGSPEDHRWFRAVSFWAGRDKRLHRLPGLFAAAGITATWLIIVVTAVVAGTVAIDVTGLFPGVVRPWWLMATGVALAVLGTVLLVAGAGTAVALLNRWRHQRNRVRRARAWSGSDNAYWRLRSAAMRSAPLPVRGLTARTLTAVLGALLWSGITVSLGLIENADVAATLAVLGGFVLLVAVAVIAQFGVAGLRLHRTFRDRHHYGLLTGDHLVQWIDTQLRGLAGQTTTLTFGDLWRGPRSAADTPANELCRDQFRRSVNLKLMVTDLSQQRPFRFPLPEQAELEKSIGSRLYACPDDLRAIFGPELTDLIAPPHPHDGLYYAWNDERGEYLPLELRPLAEPWDLPVVFAVRASMSLPLLFRAVRVFRVRPPTVVRDNFGNPLPGDGAPFTSPTPSSRSETHDQPWLLAEELWFSDGGVTSNFPVHLFDRQLPEWPTFGLNLGSHPLGYEHQDVWLPEDWQANVPRWVRVGPTAASFAGGVVDTAREWRDVMQTHMPSTRGRVAWVWLHPHEGGTNLYMSRADVASLCLRGALAGMRLRTRFEGDSDRWHRHRWMRMRAALHALDEVRDDIAIALPYYRDLLEPASAAAAADVPADGVSPPTFMPPETAFWGAAGELLDGLTAPGLEGIDFRTNTPAPAPELRHVPRV